MDLELYQEVTLTQNFPEHNLCQGDVATLIDCVPHPNNGEGGAILEVFNAIGETIAVVTVPYSSIAPLQANAILSLRPLD